MYKRFIKRFLDILFSLIGLIILAIPMLIIALLIKIDDKGPAIFVQKRFGKDKKFFSFYKFRSMKTNAPDVPTHLFKNPEQYLTRLGKILRKTSLDELPQLINILKGDMSIIGPRPALWNQDDLIEERDKYGANSLRPGLTGLAQISGRDELDIEEKALLDGKYTENLSLLMDLKCFFGTIGAVITAKGFSDTATNKTVKEKNEETETATK